MLQMNNRGMMVVFSAPSGCGKDTVFKRLCEKRNDVVKSVSATTRKQRADEIDGVNYFFISKEQFEYLIENNGLIEYTCYNGCYYGTPTEGVHEAIQMGKICFLIIEIEGAQNVMELFPECVSIFLLPPSIEVLEKRLRGRGTDSEEEIRNRMEIAYKEMSYKDIYQYNVINDDLEVCVDEIDKILCEELKKHNA